MFSSNNKLLLKEHSSNLLKLIKESITSILPIFLTVLFLSFVIVPISNTVFVAFLIGAFFLIIGIGLFSLGAEMSLVALGENVGKQLTKSKKIWVIALVGFVIGMIVTLAEPDLIVLAKQIHMIPSFAILLTVSIGVAIFLVLALLRTVFGIRLSYLLIGLYILTFGLASFVPPSFWAISFDAGGVTTGPMTVPFILALGAGVSSLRTDKSGADDSFGLVALCSIGPILSVLILGLIFNVSGGNYTAPLPPSTDNTLGLSTLLIHELPSKLLNTAISLSSIFIFFLAYLAIVRKMSKKDIIKSFIGFLYTFLGLTLFLTGAEFGFMPLGRILGGQLASLPHNWILIVISAIIGYFIVSAEPAIHVLTKQVGEITKGAIPEKAMKISLSCGVAIALSISMIRVMTGVSVMWFLGFGYGIALAMSFFTPRLFTAIAFDSGGVASGPMTATFVLPFAMGACHALGGNVLTDAFGVVAMVAMTPIITIQILGIIYNLKLKKTAKLTIVDTIDVKEEIIDLEIE